MLCVVPCVIFVLTEITHRIFFKVKNDVVAAASPKPPKPPPPVPNQLFHQLHTIVVATPSPTVAASLKPQNKTNLDFMI